jgi:hypothetical protein
MVKASWQKTDRAPFDFRWWDGTSWADAYWPHSHPTSPYMPNAPRWNISNSLRPQFDIVGENWHEQAITSVLGSSPAMDQELEKFFIAEVVPEPDNPYDVNAVSIRISGMTVGYLSAEDAKLFAPVIHRIVESGVVPVVQTRIWAARRNSGLKAAIRVALSSPEEIVPANVPPKEAHAVIPFGRSVQVSGEEDHFDLLSRYVGDSGLLLVTLHPTEVKRARSVTSALEVRLDGERVGQLTPATSAKLQPIFEEAAARGLVTGAWASLKGSRLAAELSLHVVRPEDIADSWPSASDQIPQLVSVQRVPDAYANTDPIIAPPAPSGLGAPWIVMIVVGALLAAQIPYVGFFFFLAVVAVGVFFHLKARGRAPRGAHIAPTTVG